MSADVDVSPKDVEDLAQALVAAAGAWDFMTFDEQALLAFQLLPHNPLAHLEISGIAKDYTLALLWRRGSFSALHRFFAEQGLEHEDVQEWSREYLRRSEVTFLEAETTALKAAVDELTR